jgi:hypothetical protein
MSESHPINLQEIKVQIDEAESNKEELSEQIEFKEFMKQFDSQISISSKQLPSLG